MMKNYTIIQRPSLTIVGIECRTSNAPDRAPHDIPKHWEHFYAHNISSKIPHKASNEIVALYCDYEGDHTKPYTLLIGCPVHSLDHLPTNLVAKTIPAGSYALFQAIGEHPQTLINTWGAIWQSNIQRTYTGDYEVYGTPFSRSPPEINVYVAI